MEVTEMSQMYDDKSIDALIGADRVRLRPAAMLGSAGLEGARHGFTEIYGNSLDEISTLNSEESKKLDITYYEDGSISVRDYGRGVPLGWNEKLKNWNWHNVYNELYAGGKYDEAEDSLANVDWNNFDATQFNYLFSVGLNGLGAASTQYTSEFFEVRSYRGGEVKSRSFKKGIPLVNGEPINMFNLTQAEVAQIPEEVAKTEEPDGTFVHWKPDGDIFNNIDIGGDWLFETCKYIADVAGIKLHFIDKQAGKDIIIEAGNLETLLKQRVGDEELNTFTCNSFEHGLTKVGAFNKTYVCKVDIAFAPVEKHITPICFHNSVKMQSGAQYEAVNEAVRLFMTEQAGRRSVKLDPRDYENTIAVVVSSQSNVVSFRNQTKDAVDDYFIRSQIQKSLYNTLRIEYSKGTPEIVSVVDKVIKEAQIRIQLKDEEQTIREANKVTKRVKAPEKFVSCEAYENKKYSEAELWIAEGDSAIGAIKKARNKNFQALYPIRGKGLNVLKQNIKKILKNKEIKEIFTLIGTGFDLDIRGEKLFNIDDLKFDKIIFATDADEDGYHIRVLLFTIFYRLAPKLITEGHIYIAETPRFQIKLTDGTVIYAKNDAERDKILSEHSNVASISRFKGLGEVNPDVLRETTVHPDTRNLIQLTCDLQSESERYLIDALFGADKYKQRKNIITAVLGEEVANMLSDNAMLNSSIDEEDIDEGIEYQTV